MKQVLEGVTLEGGKSRKADPLLRGMILVCVAA